MPKRVETPSYPVRIFMGGDLYTAQLACGKYCDATGACVTVEPTTYVYTGGSEPGVVIGLINYGRFPSEPRVIWNKAEEIAKQLRVALGQESYSIQAPDKTLWVSYRPADTGGNNEQA